MSDSHEYIRILSLDGGDGRCVSQLYILREYMNRIGIDSNRETNPSEHFHLIAAVGPAGVIAVLLGILKMSVEDAIASFARVCQEVYPVGDIDDVSRSARLRSALLKILSEHGAMPDTPLSQAGGTNVCLGYSSVSSMATWRAFRNYPGRQYSYDPSLIDALCGCWATPGLFQTVEVGTELEKDGVVSAEAAYPNPAVQAIQEASDLYGAEKHVGLLLSLGSGSSSRPEVGGDEKNILVEVTSRELERRFGTTGVYYRLSVLPGLAPPVQVMQESLGVLFAHTSDYLLNPVTDRVLDQVIKTGSRVSRFTLKSMTQPTAPPKVSMAGLPPLSPYFVQRDVPMNHMNVALLGSEDEDRQRVLILTGMGGSGKTQMVIAWVRLHAHCFQQILFIDGSSARSIEADLVARIKSVDRSFQGTDLASALQNLAEPNGVVTTGWCLIFDNVDDPDIDITSFFPSCDHGAIIVTSRNAQLEFISPNDHIGLDTMTKDEACDALLASALAPTEKRLPRHRELAIAIAKEFEYLPIAVIQAGCYIRKHKCLGTYLSRLETSRSELLKQTTAQRDKLRYKHSVYAAFDTTIASLSERALGLLSILSFFHYTGFPRMVISLAATKNFSHEEYKLMDRGPDFQESIDLLRQLLVPNDKFEEVELDRIIEELQQSSLVTLVSLYSDIRLRFHPLLHAWAYDRQSVEEKQRNKAAALRLLTCVVDENDGIDIESELSSHARRFIAEIDTLHVNDRGALVELADPSEAIDALFAVWERIHKTVRSAYGDSDLRTSEAYLNFGVAHIVIPDFAKMEEVLREVLQLRRSISGPRTGPTAYAMYWLASSIDMRMTNRDEMLELFRAAYEIQQEVLGFNHINTQQSMISLAKRLMYPWRGDPNYDEAAGILEKLVAIRTTLYGTHHSWTLRVVDILLDCYNAMGETKKQQLQKLLQTRQESYGDVQTDDLAVLSFQGHMYELQEKYQEAEDAYRQLLEANLRLYGELSLQSLFVVLALAKLLKKVDKKAELEVLLRQYARTGSEFHGVAQYQLLEVLEMLGACLFSQSKYAEAQTVLTVALERTIERTGKFHMFTRDTRNMLANCHYHQKNLAEAESLYRDTLESFKQQPGGEEDAGLIFTLGWIARCVYEQNRFEESEELWRENYIRQKAALGPNHPEACTALCWVILCLQKREQLSIAAPHVAEMMQVYNALEGGEKSQTLLAYWRVADVLEGQSMYVEAEEVLRARQERVKGFYGDTGREYAVEMGHLAKFMFDRRRYEESKVIREDQLRRWTELKDAKMQEFVVAKLQQIEEALAALPSAGA